MAQSKVTEFFSTRKRNRFLQDEVLLNKQQKSQTLIDSPISELIKPSEQLDQLTMLKNKIMASHERSLRSRAAKQKEQETPKEPEKPVETVKPKTRASAKNAPVKEAEAKENEIKKEEAAIVEPPAQPAKTTKRKVNKAELKAKIEQFNKNLLAVQNENKTIAQEEQKQEKKIEEPKPTVEDTKVPAYLKFQDLASKEIDQTCTLTLPKHYSLLLDSFKGSDTIVKFLFNRNEVCTFLKLRMGIQNITKHTFTLKNLGQLKNVYPEAYVYKQEKLFIDFKNDFHLIIAPNLDEIELNVEKNTREFTPGVLLKRLNKFKTNLFNLVKKFHQDFLKSLGIKDVPFDELKRWHPKFDLENVHEIEESELPKPPVDDSIKCKTGQELLSIAKDIKSARLQNAIIEGVTALETAKTKEEEAKKEETKSNEKPKSASYNALLERIKQKEKQKAIETMVLNSDKEKNISKYQQMKDFVRFLSFFFDSEKKSTLELEKVIVKMKENNKYGLGEAECREMLMNQMVSDDKEENVLFDGDKKWLNVIKVRNVSYLKMDKSFQINFLNTACDNKIEKIKST